jgi:hypothetical protein
VVVVADQHVGTATVPRVARRARARVRTLHVPTRAYRDDMVIAPAMVMVLWWWWWWWLARTGRSQVKECQMMIGHCGGQWVPDFSSGR